MNGSNLAQRSLFTTDVYYKCAFPLVNITSIYQFLHCRMNDEARRLFEELGSTAAKELAFRDSWVFVGAKGIENKSPFEQVHGHY